MIKKITYCLIFFSLFVFNRPMHAESYIIGDEDMLQISVWGNPELNVHVPVRPDGMISMTLIGDVKASGLTPQDLKKNLEKELSRYVKSPIVSVVVTAINSFKVYIFRGGASKAPTSRDSATAGNTAGGATSAGALSGQITLRRHTSLLQLLAQLGSLDDVDLKNAYLLRSGNKLDVNFENLFRNGDLSEDVKLEPNDTIFLPGGGFSSDIRVTGAVKAPGIFPFSLGMTALDAVLVAGGFTPFANENNVLIIRKDGNAVKNIEVELKDVMDGDIGKNVSLKPGDLVTVKTGLF